jgi:uncharacterized protein YdaU (DUF1376 family)
MGPTKPNKPPAFMFYVKDYLGPPAVQLMTPAQRGMYIHMLAKSWDNVPICTLPNDEVLWRAAGARSKQEWDKNKKLVLEQWVLYEETNTWFNERLMKERDNQIRNALKAKTAIHPRLTKGTYMA